MDNILISELKTFEEWSNLKNMNNEKRKQLENVLMALQSELQKHEKLVEMEKQLYAETETKYMKREIQTATYNEETENHKRRLNALDITKINLKLSMQPDCSLAKRLNNLSWFFKIPFGEDSIVVERKDRTKATIRKKDIFSAYFKSIIDSKEERLSLQQSLLRLKINFNLSKDYSVAPSHEYYMSPQDMNKARETLQNVQSEIAQIEQYKQTINNRFLEFLDPTQLTINDYFSQNEEQLYEKFFSVEEQKQKAS